MRRLQDGFERGERVLFDGEKITGERPSEQRVAKSELARVVHGMLPHVELAGLLVEVNRETGFLDEYGRLIESNFVLRWSGDPDYMHHEHINFIGRHTVDMRHGPPKGKHRPLRLPAPQATPTRIAATNETATNG